MPDAIMLSLATFIFTVFGTTVATTWRIGRMLDLRDTTIIKMMADHELADVNRFSQIRSEVVDSSEHLRREFGETGQALRQKLYEIEMWGRDHYLQITPFYKTTDKLSDEIRRLSEKVDLQSARDARVDKSRGEE